MRIAIVTMMGGAAWGGSEALWLSAANAAQQAGHTVKVFAYHTLNSPQLTDLLNAGATLSRRRFIPGTRFSTLFYRFHRTWKDLVRFKPDVLLINQSGTYDCMLAGDGRNLAASLVDSRVPYVLLSHANYEMLTPAWPMRKEMSAFFAKAYRAGFVSRRNVELAELQMARRFPNATVFRNPVNLAATDALPWPTEQPLKFAQVARIESSVKGHDLLLEVLAAETWRERDWQLSICGSGPDDEYVQELVKELNLGDRVKLTGHVDDIRSLWREHHLLILPSRTEAMPLSLVEAMLCGRPAVATDVGGISEWLQDDETGFLAAAPTVRSLARTMERAWANRDKWKSMGCAASGTAQSLVDPVPGQTLLRLLSEAAQTTGAG